MLGDVEMQDPPAIVADDKEAVADRGHGEKIHGRKSPPCDSQETPARAGPAGDLWASLHPPRDASLRYLEAEHEQFAVDAGSTPGCILRHHTEDQIPHFL
jgi:hypothetical protein